MVFRGKTVAVLLVVAVLLSSFITYSIDGFIDYVTLGRQSSKSSDFDIEKIEEAYSLIKKRYIHSPSDQQLLDGALKGMVEALKDPYSTYMDKKQAQEFMSDLESTFTGIGAEVTRKNGALTIVSPIKDSPAEKAGLKPNDQIIKIDGKSTESLSVSQAVEKIRGPKGTKVTLEILRPGDKNTFAVTVVRDEIKQETVEAKSFSGQIGYIKISQFAEGTAKDFLNSLNDLEERGLNGLVIDVRGNPGGLLESVQEILGHFVPSDQPIMMTEERGKKREVYYGNARKKKPYPIVVLIDNGSASASEILAAGIKEAVGGVLVGERSYGKGTVQTAVDFQDGSNIKLTMAKWLTPKGNWIDQHGGSKGIKPDIHVKYPDYVSVIPPQPKVALKYDMNSDQVKNMQMILDALGYSPGRKDGYFDKKTEVALQSFQRTNRLDISGQLDQETAKVLSEKFDKFLRDPDQDIQLQVAIAHLLNQ